MFGNDLRSGYIPWTQLQAACAGTFKLNDALPATARELKTEAWLELADIFIAMRDHDTAGLWQWHIQQVLTKSTARRGMAGSYFPPVPAVLSPSTEAWDDAGLTEGSSCPYTSASHSEEWALIEVPTKPPLPRPGTVVEREDRLLMKEEKPAGNFPRPPCFIFGRLLAPCRRTGRLDESRSLYGATSRHSAL